MAQGGQITTVWMLGDGLQFGRRCDRSERVNGRLPDIVVLGRKGALQQRNTVGRPQLSCQAADRQLGDPVGFGTAAITLEEPLHPTEINLLPEPKEHECSVRLVDRRSIGETVF